MTRRVNLGTFAVAVLILGGCDSGNDASPPASVPDEPVTSIPFCPVSPTNGEELDARVRTATETAGLIAAEYESDDRVVASYYLPAADRIVVRLTDDDPSLEDAIDLMAGEPIRFLIGDATFREEQQAAHDVLVELVLGKPDSPIGGIGAGSADGLVHIGLRDLDGAERFAEDWAIPGPFDIYCIERKPDDTVNASGT